MNHGYDSDDDDDYQPPQPAAGPSGLLAQLMGGGGGAGGAGGAGIGGAYGGYGMLGGFGGGYGMPAEPSAYDEYFKAYSVAVMGGNERPELMYGGKIVMPPSALAKLSAMDIPGPWTFQLRNPRNPKELLTHSGVLEFIASEGVVHLPAWMMKKLKLNEGDPVRLNGTSLPKGKLVKIQAQSTDFLEVSDPKAVLESALRYYSCLTKNDTIEITYNSLTFEFLIIDTQSQPGSTPSSGGISVIDTDLEVDFETPKGYVEPARPAPAPIATMASKLKIDLGGTDSAGSTRPPSSLGGAGGGGPGGTGVGAAIGGATIGGTSLESFTGMGQSLSGRRMKGKGLSKKVEEVDASSRINRADGPRIINSSSLTDSNAKIPAALKLPAGKFFFGYTYVPFDPVKAAKDKAKSASASGSAAGTVDAAGAAAAAKDRDAFAGLSGGGNTLSGKRKAGEGGAFEAQGKGKGKAVEEQGAEAGGEGEDPWAKLGGGNTLRSTTASRSTNTTGKSANTAAAAGAAAASSSIATAAAPAQAEREVIDATMLDEDDFWEVPDDEDDEDEVMEVYDSD